MGSRSLGAAPWRITPSQPRSNWCWMAFTHCSGEPMAYHLIDSSYYDASHFLRDANTFLGTTPRRFMALGTTFMAASIVARGAAIGPATQALHAQPR